MIAFLAISLATLLAEKKRREEAKARTAQAAGSYQERYAELAARLRAEYHPKQRAFCRSKAKRRAAKCTRRAGKTRGGCRETMARALEGRQRWLYCAATREEAKRRAWQSDTRDGWYDLLEQLGLRVARTRDEFERNPAMDVVVDKTALVIDFRNGSQLAIFAADRPEDADKLRGGEKDGVWIDEAQIFPSLTYFVDEVVDGLVKKPGGNHGEIWLTGTPSRTLAGLFFEVTKEPEQGPRMPGWEVHDWSVVDNPYFGTTPEERWDATAGDTLRTKGWDINDPPPKFAREWLGKWTKGDALYVYAVHKRPPDVFAPARIDVETGVYHHALAAADLPEFVTDELGRRLRIRWFYSLGLDFGFSPDPFAFVLWAFSPDIADLYEMASWKKTELRPRDQKRVVRGIWDQVGDRLIGCVGDAGGAQAKATIVGWRESIGLPIEEAEKHDKRVWQEHFNGELYAGNVHYREDSMLLTEQRELQWKPAKVKPGEVREGDEDVSGKREEWADRRTADGDIPGNHCCDGGLYGYRRLIGRRLEFASAPATEEERLAREEQRMSDAVKRSTERALREQWGYED